MKMTLAQTKLVGLTMELELKTKEYHQLCEDLEAMKELNLDENSEEYAFLLKRFQKKFEEIIEIKEQLKKLEEE